MPCLGLRTSRCTGPGVTKMLSTNSVNGSVGRMESRATPASTLWILILCIPPVGDAQTYNFHCFGVYTEFWRRMSCSSRISSSSWCLWNLQRAILLLYQVGSFLCVAISDRASVSHGHISTLMVIFPLSHLPLLQCNIVWDLVLV